MGTDNEIRGVRLHAQYQLMRSSEGSQMFFTCWHVGLGNSKGFYVARCVGESNVNWVIARALCSSLRRIV